MSRGVSGECSNYTQLHWSDEFAGVQVPRSAVNRPAEPWVAQTFNVFPVARKTTKARRADGPNGDARDRPCWDVRYRVDGHDFLRRFHRAAEAHTWVDELRYGHVQGWPFDPSAKQFVRPERAVAREPVRDTVFTWTAEYWDQKWSQLEPSGRQELARYLKRARRFFVDASPAGDDAVAVDAYIRHCSFDVRASDACDEHRAGEAWVRKHALALAEVGLHEVTAFLAHYRRSQRFPDRQVSPSSERRMVADLRQCWARAVREERIAASPWDRVDLRARGGASARSKTGRTALAADAEVVLSPQQVWQLAEACGALGDWGDIVVCYVLVMGFCGLRPNEAVGLVVGDLEVPEGQTGWLTVRRNHRRVPARYLDRDDDPDWGPLKGRDLAATRRVPIPSDVAGRLRSHLDRHCGDAAPHDLVFHRNGKPFDVSAFHDAVWAHARAAVFPMVEGLDPSSPLQPKLSRLRRHDLRHSACSLWLRSRVDVSVCQRWSGHKQLSVFLDIYQGLIPGREEEGAALLDAHLRTELAP